MSEAQPVYLELGGVSCFGVLHAPASRATGLAALLLPPFGWDEVCSYRARRLWADHLAGQGHAALRIDLPGTGDSDGSPRDADLLEAWTGAVGDAARELRERAPATRVVAIGIGVGGLLAVRAAARGAQIDDLVLWAVRARGRAMARELRAFAQLEEWQRDAAPGSPGGPPGDGSLLVGGSLMTAQTRAALEAVDLTALTIPPGEGRRALLLERDGIAPDGSLLEHLEAQGFDMAVAAGEGYGQMMDRPHMSRPPVAVFDRVGRWLQRSPASPAAPPAVGAPAAELVHDHDGVRLRERPLVLAGGFGILAEPVDRPPAPVGALLLNAGAIRRIGPGRLWVELARRWAAQGVPTLRLDVSGVGDADGELNPYSPEVGLYVPSFVDQVVAVLDELESRPGLPGRFVVAGLCSGAYWALWAAARDRRIQAAFLVNPRALTMDAELRQMANEAVKMASPEKWAKLLRGEVALREVLRRGWRLALVALRALAGLPRRLADRRRAPADPIDALLDELRQAGQRAVFLFSSENEPLDEQLTAEGRFGASRWPGVERRVLEGSDHTLRPLAMQRLAHAELDRLLARELEAV